MLQCGATTVAQSPGQMATPAQEGWSRQLRVVLEPSVLFLKGLLGDECSEGAIPEAGADAEACG